jgi:hypothetical protein
MRQTDLSKASVYRALGADKASPANYARSASHVRFGGMADELAKPVQVADMAKNGAIDPGLLEKGSWAVWAKECRLRHLTHS